MTLSNEGRSALVGSKAGERSPWEGAAEMLVAQPRLACPPHAAPRLQNHERFGPLRPFSAKIRIRMVRKYLKQSLSFPKLIKHQGACDELECHSKFAYLQLR